MHSDYVSVLTEALLKPEFAGMGSSELSSGSIAGRTGTAQRRYRRLPADLRVPWPRDGKDVPRGSRRLRGARGRVHAHCTAKQRQRIHPCILIQQQRQHIHIEPTKNPEQMIDNTKSEYNSGSGAETIEATLLRSAAVVSGLLFIRRTGCVSVRNSRWVDGRGGRTGCRCRQRRMGKCR